MLVSTGNLYHKKLLSALSIDFQESKNRAYWYLPCFKKLLWESGNKGSEMLFEL